MPKRALVIGGSVGGLLAANLLLRRGWEVAVFERSAGDLSDRGAGIGTRDELFAVLRQAGATLDMSATATVRARAGIDAAGAVVHTVPIGSVSSAWACVYRALQRALPARWRHTDRRLLRVEQDGAGVTAAFADGSFAHGDLLIGADGLHSTVRQQFLPQVAPRYAGYVSWRGVACATQVPEELRAVVFDYMLFHFPPAGMVLTTPMPAARIAAAPRCQFVWFRPVPCAALPALFTDATGSQHGLSIPPSSIRMELVEELKVSARTMLPQLIAAFIGAVAQPRLQPIFDLESPRMAMGRVALLGDAAFVARPHVASGVTKAALDALCLAEAVSDRGDVVTTLVCYERERLDAGRRLVARGRAIGDLMMASAGPERMQEIMRIYGATGQGSDDAMATAGAPDTRD